MDSKELWKNTRDELISAVTALGHRQSEGNGANDLLP